jgi:cytochrome c oxidase subunit 3
MDMDTPAKDPVKDPAKDKVLASWRGPDSGGNRGLGMVVFLVSLGMFFAVGIVCFLLYRLTSSASAGMDPLNLPPALWLSTARQGLMPLLYRWLKRTWVLALLFILIQAPALVELLRVHQVYVQDGRAGIYGMTFALVLLHVLHVLGGMVPLSILVWRAHQQRLHRDSLPFVQSCAAYWHFLEVVWLVLVITLAWAG